MIYAIEEPETSQQPNYQMMLMKALLALASRTVRLSSPPMSRRWPD
jgi:predicted ATPase